ncbi:MAG: hypothetical protein B6244_00575 [Candidatus Cloacimonetes bacterium 4572_55]|nr:MAG: hypothetical protein B6244_00575 [Candidatus Cloacimonetes bacterium 4572_55]
MKPKYGAVVLRWILMWIFLALLTPSLTYARQAAVYEAYRIMIENRKGGGISLSGDQGNTWQSVGKVTRPATHVDKSGFPRSSQAGDLTVCEIAADHILVKITQNYEDRRYRYGRGTLFGLFSLEAAHLQKKYRDDNTMIYTDIPAGSGIFGKYAPLLGSRFYLANGNRLAIPQPDFVPREGDQIIIIVESYVKTIRYVVFENRFGGEITAHFTDGDTLIVGSVLRPVEGVGRFIGTEFLGPGKVRQNHGSSIGISTSRRIGKKIRSLNDYRGGFQIVTSEHIYDSELLPARVSSQWMVVGPALSETGRYIDQRYPLFSRFITPGMRVEARIDNKSWEPMPEMTGDEKEAFLPRQLTKYFEARYVRRGLTHIRLINPHSN